MATAIQNDKQAATECPHCHGTGSIGTWVQWSDGIGGSSATCSVCEGEGTIDFDPVRELAALKLQLQGFLYKTWLLAGCHVRPEQGKVEHFPNEQRLRNEVLRLLKEFPEMTHSACDTRPRED